MAEQPTFPVSDQKRAHSPYANVVCMDRKSEAILNETSSRSSLRAIALGPTQIVRSSLWAGWQGVLLETHLYSPGERRSASIDKHVISLFHGSPARLEYRNVAREFVAALMRPKIIMVTPAGLTPDIRLHTPAELTHCALEAGFLRKVADEIDHPTGSLKFRPALEDDSIQRLIKLLTDELEAERPLGRLYIDSLLYAFATRALRLDVGSPEKPKSRVTGLMPRVLNRVREKIEANLDADLSLDTLAVESGYSRAYFLRMFRTATGFTPHQYVLDLRLRRAQEHLKHANSSIIDVALSCGFSSQSHLTTVFRQQLKTTPAAFRRNALGSRRPCWS